MSENSQVKEHCSVYALSSKTESEFKQQCDHDHDERCEECEAIESTLRDIERLVSDASYPSGDDRDEALYLFQTAQRAIHTWKCHQLRTVRQDQARLDVIDLLDEKTVLIVNDWAMKFLPQMYRESQTDWYAKRGISWHISVVYRRFLGELQSQAFIHIIQYCNQDSSAVISIIQHVLHALSTEQPNIKKAFLRQDNAGCSLGTQEKYFLDMSFGSVCGDVRVEGILDANEDEEFDNLIVCKREMTERELEVRPDTEPSLYNWILKHAELMEKSMILGVRRAASLSLGDSCTSNDAESNNHALKSAADHEKASRHNLSRLEKWSIDLK